jgi:FkbM family methyltransferase
MSDSFLFFTHRFQIDANTLFKLNINIFEKVYRTKEGDVVFDIGVGNGVDTKYWSESVGEEGLVYLVEPDPNCFRRLKKLIDKNFLNNVRLLNVALSNYEGFSQLTNFDNPGKNWLLDNSSDSDTEYPLVRVSTLAKVIESENLNSIDFCKVNIEGEEVRFLDGAETKIDVIKNWSISCHDFLGKNHATFSRVKQKLEKAGYTCKDYDHLDPIEKYYLYAIKP